MPYLAKVRMRANCDRGISRAGGAGVTGLSGSSCRTGEGETICSTRGLRADWSAGEVSGTNGVLTSGFAVNRASAA